MRCGVATLILLSSIAERCFSIDLTDYLTYREKITSRGTLSCTYDKAFNATIELYESNSGLDSFIASEDYLSVVGSVDFEVSGDLIEVVQGNLIYPYLRIMHTCSKNGIQVFSQVALPIEEYSGKDHNYEGTKVLVGNVTDDHYNKTAYDMQQGRRRRLSRPLMDKVTEFTAVVRAAKHRE